MQWNYFPNNILTYYSLKQNILEFSSSTLNPTMKTIIILLLLSSHIHHAWYRFFRKTKFSLFLIARALPPTFVKWRNGHNFTNSWYIIIILMNRPGTMRSANAMEPVRSHWITYRPLKIMISDLSWATVYSSIQMK